ncbi:tryptophan synthase beta subunit-like PLP-dependent enzyme [Ramicandelaber brevisporus]|nr:tryptophan synthase beta subunit-like PLP-dependent enzyme [Ramicandelaber brevisporus]
MDRSLLSGIVIGSAATLAVVAGVRAATAASDSPKARKPGQFSSPSSSSSALPRSMTGSRDQQHSIAFVNHDIDEHDDDSVDLFDSLSQDTMGTACEGGRVVHGLEGLVGHTPMMRITSLSEDTGCEILAKCEFMNPCGSSKDRVALSILREATRAGHLTHAPVSIADEHQPSAATATATASSESKPRSTVFEGTVGSTGVSLAQLAKAFGYNCHVVMPDDVAREKVDILRTLGAQVEQVRPASIVHPDHFVRVAERRATEYTDLMKAQKHPWARGHFSDQFENPVNLLIHYQTTGPEIYSQLREYRRQQIVRGEIQLSSVTGDGLERIQQLPPLAHALVAGAGTGGTIAGVTLFLKPRITGLKVVLADPQGSGLFHKVREGVMFSPEEKEGTRKRHQIDTIIEGVGINRITRNFMPISGPMAADKSLPKHIVEEFGLDSAASSTSASQVASRTASPAPSVSASPAMDASADEQNGPAGSSQRQSRRARQQGAIPRPGQGRWVDDAVKVSDEEAVRMSRYLVERDGLFVGSSTAVNCVAAVRLARKLGPGHTIVTIICDSGQRHLAKFWSDKFLQDNNLPTDRPTTLDFLQ